MTLSVFFFKHLRPPPKDNLLGISLLLFFSSVLGISLLFFLFLCLGLGHVLGLGIYTIGSEDILCPSNVGCSNPRMLNILGC